MASDLEKTRHPGIFRRGSRYVVPYRDRGKQHRPSFRTLAEAREFKGKLQGAGPRKPPTQQTVTTYANAWLPVYQGRSAHGFTERTRKAYRHSFDSYVLPRFGRWKLADIRRSDIRDWVGDLAAGGLAPSSVKKHLAAFRVMFATAVDDDDLTINPAAGVRVNSRREGEGADDERAKALTRVQLTAFLAKVPESHRLFFRFMADTGLRVSEAIGLNVGDVVMGAHVGVAVRRQWYRGEEVPLKTRNARRDVPLSPSLAQALWPVCAGRGEDAPLFATGAGTRLNYANMRRRVLDPAAKAAEVEWMTFHTLRHTCASRLLSEGGKNPVQVSKWLGHADAGFTLRTYVHLMDEGVGKADFLDSGGATATPGNGSATEGPATDANDRDDGKPNVAGLQASQ